MRRSFPAVILLATAACVDVPDGVRAQFAAPGATDRSNFRPGNHGLALPSEEPPAAKAADTAVTGAQLEASVDGGASVASSPALDAAVTTPIVTTPAADGGAP